MKFNQLVENFLSKESNVSDYRQAMQLLRSCGFLEVLRRGGFPSIINSGSDLNAMAHEGSWSNGFQTAVNQIEYLEEYYANKTDPNVSRITPDFGGKKIAVREGYMSKEEIKKF